jgi:origin recognition complex subunit 4
LTADLYPCLNAQKRAILRALQNPPVSGEEEDDDEELGAPSNVVALQQLSELFEGTTERAESNSCIVLGPIGSGKTHVSSISRTFKPWAECYIRLSINASLLS